MYNFYKNIDYFIIKIHKIVLKIKIVENNSTNNHRKGISKVKKVEKRLMKRSERQSVYKKIQNDIEFSEEI